MRYGDSIAVRIQGRIVVGKYLMHINKGVNVFVLMQTARGPIRVPMSKVDTSVNLGRYYNDLQSIPIPKRIELGEVMTMLKKSGIKIPSGSFRKISTMIWSEHVSYICYEKIHGTKDVIINEPGQSNK